MKKYLLLGVSALLFCIASVHAQNYTYWTEYFDDGALAITGTTANAATTPTPATIKTGTWTTYYSLRAGSGCSPQDPNQTSPKYLRIQARNASSPSGLSTNPNGPNAYIITPTLPYGVNTVSWKNNSTSSSGAITIYTSTDNGANWTLFQAVAVPSTAAQCDDYSVTINNAAVNKIKFQNESATANQELDNIKITSVNPILPVTLTAVKAYAKEKGVQIDWSVATEANVAEYQIERSLTGKEFSKVGFVTAKGNSTIVLNYSWFDASPSVAVNYYRLKAVDNDGSFKYSAILKVNVSVTKTEVSVAPNPIRNGQMNLQLSSLTKGSYNITLSNNLGQVVYTNKIATEGGSLNQSFILPSSVKSGIYNLQVTGGDVKLNKRVVIE